MKHLKTAALAAVLLAATAARAAEPTDAPVATADQITSSPTQAPAASAATAVPAPTATPTVSQQIDNFIRTSPAALPDNHASGVVSGEDEDTPRKVHGVVDVSVGSHGYRSAYAQSDLPIGKTGTLSIAVGETRNGWAYGGGYPYGGGYGYGYPYRGTTQSVAVGLRLGDNTGSPRDGRCRTAWNDRRLSTDQMLPVSADRFSGCPYPPDGGSQASGD